MKNENEKNREKKKLKKKKKKLKKNQNQKCVGGTIAITNTKLKISEYRTNQ
jgi:hypothetical protein